MRNRDFSSFVSVDEYEKYQKERILKVLLVSTLVITLPLLYVNYSANLGPSFYALVVLFFFCLVGLYLNSRQKYTVSAVLFTIAVYIAVFYNFLDGGGLRDPAIVALPIITVFGGLLFDRKVSILLTVISMAMVLGFYILQSNGIIDNPTTVGNATVVTILVLLGGMNAVQIAVLRVWVRNMEWVLYSNEQMEIAYDTTLEGWAKTLELRDGETEGHSRRVVKLSLELAMAMGIQDEEKLQQITRGALLHDIGKIAIPDRILLKNGALTEDEWEIIKQHPSFAEQMMSQIPFLYSAMDIPCYHHEQWDGSGYPYGLAGEDIPLAARIFSVIDNYDALRSDRPYRKAWGYDRTLEYIYENSGKMFDPKVVDAFLRMMAKKHEGGGILSR